MPTAVYGPYIYLCAAGVSEHCDGGANLVSTVVHATVGNGAGFSTGGEVPNSILLHHR